MKEAIGGIIFILISIFGVSNCEIECGTPPDDGPNSVKFPWHVEIYLRNETTDELTRNCGGTLISKKIVVTAAHCLVVKDTSIWLNKENIVVAFGEYRGDSNLSLSNTKKVRHFEITPQYEWGNYGGYLKGDIGFIVLKEPVDFVPICIDLGKKSDLKDIRKGNISRWDPSYKNPRNGNIELVEVTILSAEQCACPFHDIRKKSQIPSDKFSQLCYENNIIVEGPAKELELCKGNSGGGLLSYSDGKFYLLGVFSGNFNCIAAKGSDHKHKVATDLSAYQTCVEKYLDLTDHTEARGIPNCFSEENNESMELCRTS